VTEKILLGGKKKGNGAEIDKMGGEVGKMELVRWAKGEKSIIQKRTGQFTGIPNRGKTKGLQGGGGGGEPW